MVVIPWALVAWTLFVWGTRIRNILADGGGTAALAVAGGLTLLAVASAVALSTGRLPLALPVLAGATIVAWAVRVPLVLTGGHGVAFVVVHLVLAAVSVGLAVLALRQRGRVGRPATGSGSARPRRLAGTR